MWCRIVEESDNDPKVFEFQQDEIINCIIGIKPNGTRFFYLAKETSPINRVEEVIFHFKTDIFQVHLFSGEELMASCRCKHSSYTVDDSMGVDAEHFQAIVLEML